MATNYGFLPVSLGPRVLRTETNCPYCNHCFTGSFWRFRVKEKIMIKKMGIVMDPISFINIKKDTSFAILLEAQRRGWQLHYMEMADLFLRDGDAQARTRLLKVKQDEKNWYSFAQNGETRDLPLQELDVILMRKNPPFNMDFIYATYILERAEAKGTLVVNKPQSLRDCNEKLFTSWFSAFTPETLVCSNMEKLREFHKEQQDIILKPLDGMGGSSVFRITKEDANLSVILETLTENGRQLCMAQRFLPDIKEGDKRILVVDGEPVPYCLARIPARGETRGNLAAGGRGEVRPLTNHDLKIANSVGPVLKEKGLLFVGLDIIGYHLTEINVTSPTCVREIEMDCNISITARLMDAIEKRLFQSKEYHK